MTITARSRATRQNAFLQASLCPGSDAIASISAFLSANREGVDLGDAFIKLVKMIIAP